MIEVDFDSGRVTQQWQIAGVPDATFFNPATGLVHVAIGTPGLVQSLDPRTGSITEVATAPGAHTTAFAEPDRLYVFSSARRGALVFADK